MLSAFAWDEKLHGQQVDREDIAGLLEVATEGYRFDMLNPEEIEDLGKQVTGNNSVPDRERAAIYGALQLLSSHAWSERLYGEPVEVGDILDVATECSRYDMMSPVEIQALGERLTTQ